MHKHGPGLLTLADEVQPTLAGAQPHVGDIRDADLGDACASVQRQQGARARPQARSTTGRQRRFARRSGASSTCRGTCRHLTPCGWPGPARHRSTAGPGQIGLDRAEVGARERSLSGERSRRREYSARSLAFSGVNSES